MKFDQQKANIKKRNQMLFGTNEKDNKSEVSNIAPTFQDSLEN